MIWLSENLPNSGFCRSACVAIVSITVATVTDAKLQLWEPAHQTGSSSLPDHSKVLLYVSSHKTSKYTCVQRIELSSSGSTQPLLEQLVEFVCRDRPQLLQGHAHDWLFVVRVYITCTRCCSTMHVFPTRGPTVGRRPFKPSFYNTRACRFSTNALRVSYVN